MRAQAGRGARLAPALDRLPDVLLVGANLALLALSGDARIFVVSTVAALTLRYALLSALVYADWRNPGWFAGSRLRRMVRDPSEGGAYDGGGAETPLWGHFAFLGLFGWLPAWAMFAAFGPASGAALAGWTIAALAAVELRDIVVGRVIYFRSGAGQQRNASWNFTQVLALAATVVAVPALIFPALLVAALDHLVAQGALWRALAARMSGDEVALLVVSLWVLVAFHTLLFLDGARRRAPAAGPRG